METIPSALILKQSESFSLKLGFGLCQTQGILLFPWTGISFCFIWFWTESLFHFLGEVLNRIIFVQLFSYFFIQQLALKIAALQYANQQPKLPSIVLLLGITWPRT